MLIGEHMTILGIPIEVLTIIVVSAIAGTLLVNYAADKTLNSYNISNTIRIVIRGN